MNIGGRNWSPLQILMLIVAFGGAVAIMYVALGVFGIVIPAWVTTIFWIVVVVFVAILAIKFIASMIDGGPPGTP